MGVEVGEEVGDELGAVVGGSVVGGDGDVAAMVRPGYVYATSIADVPSSSAAAAQVHRTDNDGHSRSCARSFVFHGKAAHASASSRAASAAPVHPSRWPNECSLT